MGFFSGNNNAWRRLTGQYAASRATEHMNRGVQQAIDTTNTATTTATDALNTNFEAARAEQDRLSRLAQDSQTAAYDAARAAQAEQFGLAQTAQNNYYSQALAQQQQAQQAQQAMLQPFYNQAQSAMGQMGNLTGMGGADAQQAAISQLENDPRFQAQIASQESAMLQNASATGGLRGGNIQGALAQFRPEMLRNEIQQQMSNLGGIANMGMNPLAQAAGGVMQAGQGAAGLLAQQGQGSAGMYTQLGQGQAGLLAGQGQGLAGLYTGQGQAVAGLQNQQGQQAGANRLSQYQLARDGIFGAIELSTEMLAASQQGMSGAGAGGMAAMGGVT